MTPRGSQKEPSRGTSATLGVPGTLSPVRLAFCPLSPQKKKQRGKPRTKSFPPPHSDPSPTPILPGSHCPDRVRSLPFWVGFVPYPARLGSVRVLGGALTGSRDAPGWCRCRYWESEGGAPLLPSGPRSAPFRPAPPRSASGPSPRPSPGPGAAPSRAARCRWARVWGVGGVAVRPVVRHCCGKGAAAGGGGRKSCVFVCKLCVCAALCVRIVCVQRRACANCVCNTCAARTQLCVCNFVCNLCVCNSCAQLVHAHVHLCTSRARTTHASVCTIRTCTIYASVHDTCSCLCT